MKKRMVIKMSSMALLLASCTSGVKFTNSGEAFSSNSKPATEITINSENHENIIMGQASYYADYFDGRMTANGEKFDQKQLTAAHKTLPFGTMLKVKNLDNGKVVEVRVNDRGPYVGNRVLDLSKSAAQILGMTESGLANVEIFVN